MRYLKKPTTSGVTRFTKAPMSDVQYSRMKVPPSHFTTFNAGDIVPIYNAEILPHDTFSIDVDFVLRQTTLLKPVMGDLDFDIYAFWVSNQTVNESWKNVQGENTSGFWTAPEVELAPLLSGSYSGESVQVPVGSVADYYGFPTQAPIRSAHLMQCHDLLFRGYLEIYNTNFRDENFQNPIPYSKLNIYEGFFEPVGKHIGLLTSYNNANSFAYYADHSADGSYGVGALTKAMYGDGGKGDKQGAGSSVSASFVSRVSSFSALDKPLKANKLHDPFTSGLPSPQKGADIVFGVGDVAPVKTRESLAYKSGDSPTPLYFVDDQLYEAGRSNLGTDSYGILSSDVFANFPSVDGQAPLTVVPANQWADLSQATGVSINDLRTAIATQQVYETLARGGSRYLEIIRSFFEIETETPFSNVPILLGHLRNVLDMYQVAQTSASVEGDTAQGNLSAFGYTTKGGKLFTRTFLEHGYIHILAVVRQKNLYTTYLSPDKFRRSTLDFYLPQLANIGEQPIPLRTLNPFIPGHDDGVMCYQEAWWEYRYEPDIASGYFRQGLSETLVGWTYGDPYDPNFTHVNGEWLKSNAQQVVDTTVVTTSALAHQFFGIFTFTVDKQRPMPVYSVPGLDQI